MSTHFAAPAPNSTTATAADDDDDKGWEANFEAIAAAQRLRDDLFQSPHLLPLGGWTAELVPRSTEYERKKDDDAAEDEDDDGEQAEAGSADVDLTEKQLRALPYRLARDVKKKEKRRSGGGGGGGGGGGSGGGGGGGDPLKRWAKLACDFPAYRGSLAGPMPKRVGAAEAESWVEDLAGGGGSSSLGGGVAGMGGMGGMMGGMATFGDLDKPGLLDSLWVAGEEIQLRPSAPHGVVRAALQAVDAHFARLRELRAALGADGGGNGGGSSGGGSGGGGAAAFSSAFSTTSFLSESSPPPRRLDADALARLPGTVEVYNTAADAEASAELREARTDSGNGKGKSKSKSKSKSKGDGDGASPPLVEVLFVVGAGAQRHGAGPERAPARAAQLKQEVAAFLRALDRFADLDNDDHCATPVSVRLRLEHGPSRAALAWLADAAAAAMSSSSAPFPLAARKFLEGLRSGDAAPAALKKAVAKLKPRPAVPEGLFEEEGSISAAGGGGGGGGGGSGGTSTTLHSLGLAEHPTPFVLVDGRIVNLDLDLIPMDAGADLAQAIVERVAKRDPNDDGP